MIALIAMHVAQSLTQIDACNQTLAKTLETDARLLTELRTAMATNMDTIGKSLETVEKRVTAVTKK